MGVTRYDLTDKVVIVTGASRGIGETMALAFADAGADVAICARTTEDSSLEKVAQRILDRKRRSLAVRADVSNGADVENFVNQVMREFGRIDVLVNNAGVFIQGSLLELPEKDWDRILNTNLKGYYLCSQAVGRRMVEHERGAIINIGSTASFGVNPSAPAYSIAKAGVLMLTKALALEMSRYNIRVNGIAPHLTRTKLSEDKLKDSEFMKRMESRVPLRRVAEPGDLTGAALFLASEDSRYITGHTIVVDGGFLLS